ncbi:MAG: TlpA family protein disulfide reductase [Micrococcales bacterium]|nr:TlpA family protein disulfide reductase [Micrococcales bacterium]MCL2667390.1 TlpA family protein disulfide reductase [Micrococcales bacterium]
MPEDPSPDTTSATDSFDDSVADVVSAGPSRWQQLRRSPLWTVAVLVVTALVVLGGVWLVNVVRGDDGSAVELAAGARPVEVGKAAPGFSATPIDGERLRLEDLRGRTVWLVFGATWCPDCRKEAATLQAVQAARDDVVIIAVYVSETNGEVESFVAGAGGLDYLHIADVDHKLGSIYRADGLPRHVLVDSAGIVRRIDVGAVDKATANARLDELAGR